MPLSVPWAPSPAQRYRPRPQRDSRVSDLMLRQGEIEARGAEQSGQIWGRLAESLGQIAGQYFDPRRKQEEERQAQDSELRGLQIEGARQQQADRTTNSAAAAQEATEQAAEDERVRALFSGPEPPNLEQIIRSHRNPAKGIEVAKGYQALGKFGKSDPKEHGKLLGQVLSGFDNLSEENRAFTYPKIRETLIQAGQIKPEDIPEQYPGETWWQTMRAQGPAGADPDKAADNARQQAQFEETRRHNRATEANAAGSEGSRPVAVLGDDGQPIYVKPGAAVGRRPAPSTTARDTTEDERKTAGFYSQMQDAISVIDELEGALTQKEIYQIQTLPQEGLTGMANRGELSEGAKRYLRAFEQFTEARLRPVSGAAIADSEYQRDRRTYAKQYGETPKLSEDRKRARSGAAASLKTRAGRALAKDEKKVDPLGLR